MLTFSWWKLSPSATASSLQQQQQQQQQEAITPTAPAKAVVQLTMRACAPGHCTWKAPVVSNVTGVPVGVVALARGSVLAAKAGLTAAPMMLTDNEDGTWAIRLGLTAQARHICATPQPAGTAGGALLVLSSSIRGPVLNSSHTPPPPSDDAPSCARFRLQVMTGGAYALRSASIGLWVVVGEEDGLLRVEAEDPRSTAATAFTFMTTLGLPPH